jgi:ABC-type multidrug transport system, ATPase and permease components
MGIYLWPITLMCLYGLLGSIVILWSFYGPAYLVGIGYLVILVPLQLIFTNKTEKIRKKKNLITDERVRLTNEIIDCIRMLKMYTWELSFMEKVKTIRKKEIKLLKEMLSWDYFQFSITMTSSAISSFLLFLTVYFTNGQLSLSHFVCNELS